MVAEEANPDFEAVAVVLAALVTAVPSALGSVPEARLAVALIFTIKKL